MGSVSEAIKHAADVKRTLNSKYNQFHFITVVTIDLNAIDIVPYESYIIEKIQTINNYIDHNKIAPMTDKFVKDSCFFCLYKKLCKTI